MLEHIMALLRKKDLALTPMENLFLRIPAIFLLLAEAKQGYGHVAIITEVGNDYITVIEQNWARNDAIHQIPYDKAANRIGDANGDRGNYHIQGWLRKDTWHFNTPGNTEGWTAVNIEEYSVNDEKYFINPQHIDPRIYSASLSLDADNYNAIEINMASNAPDENARIYFTTTDSSDYSEDKRVSFKANNDGDWHTYTVYMAGDLWKGATITGIRIDPADFGKEGIDKTDTIGFDWIKAVKIEHPRYDINEDGIVSTIDATIWRQAYYYYIYYHTIICERCDCNKNGYPDTSDWALVASNFGKTIPTV